MSDRITDALYDAVRATGASTLAARATTLPPERLQAALSLCALLATHLAELAERWAHSTQRVHVSFRDRGPSVVAELGGADLGDPGRGRLAVRIAAALDPLHHEFRDVRRRATGLYRAFDALTGPVHELGHTTRPITLTL